MKQSYCKHWKTTDKDHENKPWWDIAANSHEVTQATVLFHQILWFSLMRLINPVWEIEKKRVQNGAALCLFIYLLIRIWTPGMKNEPSQEGMCTKQHQSLSVVSRPPPVLSIRWYTELLKSYSHLIIQPGVALIPAWQMGCQTFFQTLSHGFPIYTAAVERRRACDHLKNFSDWDQRSGTRVSDNRAVAGAERRAPLLWLSSVSAAADFQYSFAARTETIQAIFFAIMFSLLLFCGKSPFHSSPKTSERAGPRWLIQVLLRANKKALGGLQISPSVQKWSQARSAVSAEMRDLTCQLMSCLARKHFSWLWPGAVLINTRGILIEASVLLESKASFHS